MAEALGSNSGARFQVWIRRRVESAGPYSIRFEVTEGKGILRVVRPGVLVDPPARPSGFEERLSAAQVGTTRFLHVWDGGRYRQPHSFARLDASRLDTMPLDRWIALVSVTEGATSIFHLPTNFDTESGRHDDEPTWPRRAMLAELQRELRQMEASGADSERTTIHAIPAEALRPGPKPSRAERVDIGSRAPTSSPAAPAPTAPEPEPDMPMATLDAWLNSPRLARPRAEEEQTVLMAGSALAIDDLGSIRPVHARLDALPAPPSSVVSVSMLPEDNLAIEASGDPDDDDMGEGIFHAADADEGEGIVDAVGETAFEVLEADADDGGFAVVDDELPGADHALRAAPSGILQRGQLTEPVTIMPPDIQAIATGGAAATAAARVHGGLFTEDDAGGVHIEAGEADDVEVVDEAHAAGAPHPFDTAPVPTMHERNTTLVRFLRRRIASDRTRIAALEHRIVELEAIIGQRATR